MKKALLFIAVAVMLTSCAKQTNKETQVDYANGVPIGTDCDVVVDAKIPQDYPPELIPPNANFTHGMTGMMKAEANPESNAHFMTYDPRDSVLAFFRSVEGWEMRFEGLDSAGVYTIAFQHMAELSDFQMVVELIPSTDDEGNPVILIITTYGSGIGIRYPDYFYEFAPPDEDFPHE